MLDLKYHIKPMIVALFVLVVALPQTSWGYDDQSITIPFRMVNGLIILQAEVDGVEGDYLLDTGADAVFLDGELAQKDQVLTTLTGELAMSAHKIAHLKIGAFSQYEINAHIISLAALKAQLGIDLHGIIGGGHFIPHALVMDFVASTITIAMSTPAEITTGTYRAARFQMIREIPMVKVNIEGTHYEFVLDSGATVHFIEEQLLSTIRGLSPLAGYSAVQTVNKRQRGQQRYHMDLFKLGKSSFQHHQFLTEDFVNISTEMGRSVAGILSLHHLAQEKVIFDFQNHVLYFK